MTDFLPPGLKGINLLQNNLPTTYLLSCFYLQQINATHNICKPINGTLVIKKAITGEKVTVDVKALPVGFYSYQLKNISTGNASYGKLQIQR